MFACISLILALASGDDVDASHFDIAADEAIHLLQIAARKHNHTHDLDQTPHSVRYSSGDDGYCAFWGDTHTVASYNGKLPDPNQHGLYTLANSKDGRFKSQLYQCSAHTSLAWVGWINALAYEIDGTRIVILPPLISDLENNYWATVSEMEHKYGLPTEYPFYIRANDHVYSSAELPFTIPGTSIELRAHKAPQGLQIVTEGFDAHVKTVTTQYPDFWIDTSLQLSPDNVPDNTENGFCTKGPAALPLADDTMETDWSDSLFTNADHDRICDYCVGRLYSGRMAKAVQANIKALKCAKPPPAPPLPTAQESCESNGCSWTHGQQMCNSLKGDDTLYNDCVFDFCLECREEAAVQFVEEDEDENPDPLCVAGAPECEPEEVCTNAISMNTLTVTQNNFGGVGPDSGAEEIRYNNAAVVAGRPVDLVLTTDGTFESSKPSKNGNAGAFGVLNVKCGTSVTVTMKVVDSENGSPVVLDAVALTWYDLDEGKKAKGRATVTTCGSTGAIVSENTELTLKREGDCTSATSSVAGTGKDNPKSPHQLTSVQVSRAFTLPFKQVSEFTSTLTLEKGFKGRNFLFAIEPSVACL